MSTKSFAQAVAPSLQVFLSYSRKDLGRAEKLRDALISAGFGAYLDQHDILPGEPWRERLAGLIQKADTVVFLLSPASAASDICDWEVNEAERLSKRIVPVVIREPDPDAVPGRLKRLNYIFLRNPTEEGAGFEKLQKALLTDIAWVREHTRLGELAAEWEGAKLAPDRLLRGSALSSSELWLSQPHSGGQGPTELQRTFIAASRQAEIARLQQERDQIDRTRRFQRRAAWALAGVAVVLLGGSLAAGVAYREASKREARVLTSKAREALDRGNLPLALRYAVAGLPAPGALPLDYWSPELEGLLGTVAGRYTPLLRELASDAGRRTEVKVDHGSNRALIRGDKAITLWNTRDGNDIRSMPTARDSSRPNNFVITAERAVVFDGSSIRIVATSSGDDLAVHDSLAEYRLWINAAKSHILATWTPWDDKAALPLASTARVFSLADGRELPSLGIRDRLWHRAEIARDGSRVAFRTALGHGYVYDTTTGRALVTLADPARPVADVRLSPDDRLALIVFRSKETLTGTVFDAQDGKLISTISDIPQGETASVDSSLEYRISHNSDYLFRLNMIFGMDSDVPQIQVWSLTTGSEIAELRRAKCFNKNLILYASGNPPQSRAIAGCGNLELMDPAAGKAIDLGAAAQIGRFHVESPAADRMALSFDGFYLHDTVTGARIGQDPISESIFPPVFSPDGARVIGRVGGGMGGSVERISLRDARTGKVVSELRPFESFNDPFRMVLLREATFSERGTWLATRHESAVVLWDASSGKEVSRIVRDPQAKLSVTQVHFAGANEDRLITVEDGTVRLWDISWRPQSGRALVDDVCRQKLLGADKEFSPAEMQDPIFAGQQDRRTPCSRTGPLTLSWWFSKLGLEGPPSN